MKNSWISNGIFYVHGQWEAEAFDEVKNFSMDEAID